MGIIVFKYLRLYIVISLYSSAGTPYSELITLSGGRILPLPLAGVLDTNRLSSRYIHLKYGLSVIEIAAFDPLSRRSSSARPIEGAELCRQLYSRICILSIACGIQAVEEYAMGKAGRDGLSGLGEGTAVMQSILSMSRACPTSDMVDTSPGCWLDT